MNDLTDLTHLPADCPIRPSFTQIDDLQIRYAKAERSDAETLLLLSPMPESLFAFLPIWEALAERFDLLAVDLPGFGASAGRSDVIAPRAMGDFIAKAVDHFDLKRPHAIGPDIGTSSLLFAAASHPDVFASITIGSGGAAFPLEVESMLKEIIDLPSVEPLLQMPVAELIDSVLASLQNYQPPAFVREDYVRSYSGSRFAEAAGLLRAYPRDLALLADRLSDIKTPVLVIQGKRDPFVPVSNGEYLVARLPTCRLEVLDTGHLVWEDAADAYARLVLDWVAAHARG
jgi:pimeloyl-ACP methyl ester carboxylesterase